ncbi:hypothetical protein pb186bvf_008458 [Paramecium bursaria]
MLTLCLSYSFNLENDQLVSTRISSNLLRKVQYQIQFCTKPNFAPSSQLNAQQEIFIFLYIQLSVFSLYTESINISDAFAQNKYFHYLMMFFIFLLQSIKCRFSFGCSNKHQTFEIDGKLFCKDPNGDMPQMPDPRLRLELIDCDYKPFEYTALNTSLYVNINEIHHTGTLNDISQNTSITRSNQIKVMKDIYLKNTMSMDVQITNIYSSSNLLRAQFDKVEMLSGVRQKAFTVIFSQVQSDVASKSFEIWVAIEIGYEYRIPLRILIYDKNLQCGHHKIPCSFVLSNKELDFGKVAIHQQIRRKYLINNPNPLKIDVNFKNQEYNNNQVRIILESPELLKSCVRRKMNFELLPLSNITLIIVINTNQYGQVIRELTLKTPYEFIDLRVEADIVQGSLNFYPNIIAFDPYVLNQKQNVIISMRQTFKSDIEVNEASHLKDKQLQQINITQLIDYPIRKNRKFSIFSLEYQTFQLLTSQIVQLIPENQLFFEKLRNIYTASEVMQFNNPRTIYLNTTVAQQVELPIFFKATNITVLPINNKRNHKLEQNDQLEYHHFMQIFIIILNIIYLTSRLKQILFNRWKVPETSKYLIELQKQSFAELSAQYSLQNLFLNFLPPQIEKPISEETLSKQFSQEIEDEEYIQEEEEQSSSSFSQGESISQEDKGEFTSMGDILTQQDQQQNKFNIFNQYPFTVPNKERSQPPVSELLFCYPHQSDSESDNDGITFNVFKQPQLNKLPSFQQSKLQIPQKLNEKRHDIYEDQSIQQRLSSLLQEQSNQVSSPKPPGLNENS